MNSGRLAIISATVSPRLTPSRTSPPANASTFACSSDHVQRIGSSAVRTATPSGWASTVKRKASAIVAAAADRPMSGTLPDVEASVGDPADVVGEPDHEQPDYQREADEAG